MEKDIGITFLALKNMHYFDNFLECRKQILRHGCKICELHDQ